MRLSWSDPALRNVVWQAVIVAALAAVVAYLVHNTRTNLAARHIATGFAFLGRNAGIPIGESLLPYNPAVSTYGDALVIGVLNTLKVAFVGIVLATVLGTLIGVARLSRNWLLARAAAVYVEVVRDVPLLLQLFFWYVLLRTLPSVRDAANPLPGVFLSNRPRPGRWRWPCWWRFRWWCGLRWAPRSSWTCRSRAASTSAAVAP